MKRAISESLKGSKAVEVFEPLNSNLHQRLTTDDKLFVPGSNPGGAILSSSSQSLVVVSGNRDINSVWDLSQEEIKQAIATLSKVRKTKYVRCKGKKYGTINKGFTDDELKKFLECCKNDKARLAYSLMALLGLRVGEVVNVRLDDMDFERNKIRISTEKANTGDFLYLHEKVRIILQDWIEKHEIEIRNHDNYLLFAESVSSKKSHLSKDWLRNYFKKVLVLANLAEYYAYSDESRYGSRKNRKLYRLTTHSLRHYFITKVHNKCKDVVQTQKLARHQDMKSTQTYIHVKQEKLDNTLKSTFEQQDSEMQEYLEYLKFKRMRDRLGV